MKPFSADDLHFLDAAAPHITHALKTARLLSTESAAGDDFERFADASMGVALMDFGGRVIAMNREAERLSSTVSGLTVSPSACDRHWTMLPVLCARFS